MVVDAVARDYRMEAIGHIGWPFTRWVQAFRPRPLRRLRLGTRPSRCATRTCDPSWAGRPSTAQPSGKGGGRARDPQPRRGRRGRFAHPWADAMDAAADPPGGSLTDDLDRAVVATRCAAATHLVAPDRRRPRAARALGGRWGALVRAPVGFGALSSPCPIRPGRWRGASALPVDRRWAGPGLVARRPVTSVRRCRGPDVAPPQWRRGCARRLPRWQIGRSRPPSPPSWRATVRPARR